ncbi:MAG: ATPase [Rhodospirillaceae bacterium]|nr:ATPase [Rhodospirillaceae bacterium]
MKKRFYKSATIAPDLDANGYLVSLDDKKIMSPAGKEFLLPTSALAEAIASEWNAQTDEIIPSSMPMMQIAGTAIDRVSETRQDVIEGILKYAQTDLLCHLAENPPDLVKRQREKWQPLLDWAHATFGARLVPTNGIMPKPQSDDAINALRAEIEKIDNFNLTALAVLTGTCGSIILALALYHGRISGEETFECSMLDNAWQVENWGEDWETKERSDAILSEIKQTETFFSLLG